MLDRINFRMILLITSMLGILAVCLGAFGAHGLKEVLPPEKLSSYTTGITYHFYHTLALLGVSILLYLKSSRWIKIAAFCFIIGIILFSGSIYLLATREIIGLDNYKWLGPITPIGGVFFIIGWLSLGIAAFKFSVTDAAK